MQITEHYLPKSVPKSIKANTSNDDANKMHGKSVIDYTVQQFFKNVIGLPNGYHGMALKVLLADIFLPCSFSARAKCRKIHFFGSLSSDGKT